MATGGAGRVFLQNTNGGIVTGDGMALAYRHGVPLRDMEFVQYHPTCMPGTGLLFTEGCRGEGGILTNKDGYRYLQDYGLGPPDPWPRNKAMELGPRDRISQAFTPDPPQPGKPRLRLDDYPDPSPNWTSQHDGAKFFGMGCAQLIRNLATHTGAQPDEQNALEELAALSGLARLIDRAKVVH